MKTLKSSAWLVATILFVLAGCASKSTMTSQERDDAYDQFIIDNELERTDRIPAYRFEQWTALGSKHLILYRNFREPYLVTLQRDCFDLDHAFQLAVESSGGSLNAKFDYVMVPDAIPVKCFIGSIHKINNEQKKQLMAIGKPVEGGSSKEGSETLGHAKSAD